MNSTLDPLHIARPWSKTPSVVKEEMVDCCRLVDIEDLPHEDDAENLVSID